MVYRRMTVADIEKVIPLYIEYYNGKEDGEWTEQTTYKRIHQYLAERNIVDRVYTFAEKYGNFVKRCMEFISSLFSTKFHKNNLRAIIETEWYDTVSNAAADHHVRVAVCI